MKWHEIAELFLDAFGGAHAVCGVEMCLESRLWNVSGALAFQFATAAFRSRLLAGCLREADSALL